MKKYFNLLFIPVSIYAISFLSSYSAFCQEPEETPPQTEVVEVNAEESSPGTMDEIVVTATKKEKSVFNLPYSANVIKEEQIRNEKLSKTTPAILEEDPSIMVQKTSAGQNSPFLRGFTGFRTLFLIDGIRLNNSVFRDGPNQYWNTVDPFTISHLEVVKGPSSVLWGSDAIGGTVNALTRSRDSYENGFHLARRAIYRFGSADKSNIGRMELSGNFNNAFGMLMGGAFKNFNSITGGKLVGHQPRTGYEEINADAKFEFPFGEDSKAILAYQHVDQNDAWRAHKTIYGISWRGTTIGDEKERSFNQNRDLLYLQYRGRKLPLFFEEANLNLSWHLQQEQQFRIRGDDRSDIQGFKVNTLGFFSNFTSPTVVGELTYGLEYYRDFVDSDKTSFNADGTVNSIALQGPVADDASYDLLGVFFQDELNILKKLSLTFGIRYTFARADAGRVEDPVSGDPISVSGRWHSITESARLLYKPVSFLNLFGGISRGFRAPNLSDLTRLDSARTDEIETPSPGLSPETFISYEFGTKLNYRYIRAALSFYFTDINDMIISYPTGSVIDGENEIQKANAGEGYVTGVEFNSDYDLNKEWSVHGGIAWQKGQVDTYPTSAQILERRPMSRIPPLTGLLGLRWKHSSKKYWAGAVVKIAGKQDELSPSDEADTQRIPPGGTPGYAVLNLSGGLKVKDNLTLSAAVENVTNEDYRIHGSGQNEPGTNFIISADLKF